MASRNFENYGTLYWLNPNEFWNGGWVYVDIEQDEDGEPWDIVGQGYETRYTEL